MRLSFPVRVLLLLFLVVAPRYAQGVLPEVLRGSSADSVLISCGVATTNTAAYVFWNTPASVWFARGTGGGWQQPVLAATIPDGTDSLKLLACGALSSGRVFFSVRGLLNRFYYSDNQGASFSSPVELPCGNALQRRSAANLSFFVTPQDSIFCTYARQEGAVRNVYLIKSGNGGATWSPEQLLQAEAAAAVIRAAGGYRVLVYKASAGQLVYRISGATDSVWSNPLPVPVPAGVQSFDVGAADTAFTVLYTLRQSAGTGTYMQEDIYEARYGVTAAAWQQPRKLTTFTGQDTRPAVAPAAASAPMFAYLSSRGLYRVAPRLVCVARTDGPPDTLTPPAILGLLHPVAPEYYTPGQITLYASHASGIAHARVLLQTKFKADTLLTLYDDGAHADSASGDMVFGAVLPGIAIADTARITIQISGNMGAPASVGPIVVAPKFSAVTPSAFFWHNSYRLPFDNRGNLADVAAGGDSAAGRYQNLPVLLSGGFYLSGKANGVLWGNGVHTGARLNDFQPGPVGFNPTGSGYGIYRLAAGDPPFSSSWQRWRLAVTYGAPFYDGNHDGIYNPVDLNANNQWDPAEDAPDLLGGFSAWCVFNDGVAPANRRFPNQQPLGIEVQQTVFSPVAGNNATGRFHCIRYRLINRNPAVTVFDSVFFSSALDPDIGSYEDDFAGSDTVLNAAFAYNRLPDGLFGAAPPALINGFVQGPPVYVPGVTFTDVNHNSRYDEGTDIPLDSAKDFRGPSLGRHYFRGAANGRLASMLMQIPIGGLGKANTVQELRNLMLGKTLTGQQINPCTYSYGTVNGEPCSAFNPAFMFPSNPVAGTGWLQAYGTDVSFLMSAGPFTLEYNKPVDIIIAQGVGISTTPVGSVAAAKRDLGEMKSWYASNWSTEYVTGVLSTAQPLGFALLPSYPNPFNPSTTINYTIPPEYGAVTVKLAVYTVLGSLVETLVNETQQGGAYSAQFNASRLASGAYIIRLQAGTHLAAQKILLLK